MKILFTADLHIKLGQKNVPVEWARNRYTLLFEQLKSASQKVDMVVLGGDIFDRVPSMEEIEVYSELLSVFECKTIIYSGNHEALKKNTTFLTYLKKLSTAINNKVEILDDFYSIDNLDFIPYNKLKEYDPKDVEFHGDILFTHVRGNIPPHVKSEVPLSLFSRWKLVVAGDLHSHENSQDNVVYPGSPCTTSFHRNRVDTGYLIIDTVSVDYIWEKLTLPQLIRKTVKAGDSIEATGYDHTIYEIEGDMSELSNITDNDLIDKKVIMRSSDTALILDPKMNMAEELREYLLYILLLEEPFADSIINILNDNMDKISD